MFYKVSNQESFIFHNNFKIESNGQFNEYQLILRAIDIIIEKLGIIKENVSREQYSIIITENNSVIIEIVNEDHSCGGPINFTLQNMEEVIFSGVSKPNYMEKNICIKFSVNKNYKPIEIFEKAILNTVKQYKNIKDKISELYNSEENDKSQESKKIKKSSK
jgi:DNA-directed RNA polymerase subunit L